MPDRVEGAAWMGKGRTFIISLPLEKSTSDPKEVVA